MKIHIQPAEPEPELSEEYYEHLARTMGEERAAWARLPREAFCERYRNDTERANRPGRLELRARARARQREKELRWYHDNFNTPDDLSVWPRELDGGVNNP